MISESSFRESIFRLSLRGRRGALDAVCGRVGLGMERERHLPRDEREREWRNLQKTGVSIKLPRFATPDENQYVSFMFLTFEGLDSSGKTTQARIVAEARRAATGRVVHFIREPGGTPISERLRAILLDKKNLELSEQAELLLFSASRAQLVRQLIQPALLRGETVICDRYMDSTTAYQGYGRGLDLAAVNQINRFATAGVAPDLTILVDIAVEEIDRRKRAAGTAFDRMESAGREFYERVRGGYLAIASEHADRCVVVNGMRSVEEIAGEIAAIVREREKRPTTGA
jgi:dTMP kinase